MSNQLVMNITAFETRVALIENSLVTELFIERTQDRGIIGNIYLGRVQRVLPGMQAAFVELGLEKAAFLYVGDVVAPEIADEEAENEFLPSDEMAVSAEVHDSMPPSESDADKEKEPDALINKEFKKPKFKRILPPIETLLRPGQEILVQVTKEPIGTKGPRVSCNISLPGQQLVFMPTYDRVGISRKITDDAERERLRTILGDKKQNGVGGFVARTVAAGLSPEVLAIDADFLVSMWDDIKRRAALVKAPHLVQAELDVALKCIRDMTNDNIDKVIVDDELTFKNIGTFSTFLAPALSDKIELYQGPNPIFDAFGVEAEIARAMQRKVWLRSGGYLVIDEAEALVVIDVNTGRFVGRRNLEDTILITNLEAVQEVAYQLRLRNIGGMVIIDFIDMENKEHQERVLATLTASLRKDRARCNVVRISELGLVEMTRQRTRESIERQLCESCFYCDGTGTLKSRKTIAFEIFRAICQKARVFVDPAIIVHAHPEVVDIIYGEEEEALSQIENDIGKRIIIKPRGSFHQEHFDIFGGKVSQE